MIVYKPTDKEVIDKPLKLRPRTAFIMTKLGEDRSEIIDEIYDKVKDVLSKYDFSSIDASSITTGRDFLQKIVDIIISVPLGIVILDKDIPSSTLSNCFYEMGWLDALGKETLIIISTGSKIPSDLIRTEHIKYGKNFEKKLSDYMDNLLELADYYTEVAQLIENNPLLAIDYYRRSYLINNKHQNIDYAINLTENDVDNKRSKNSVENLLRHFTNSKQ